MCIGSLQERLNPVSHGMEGLWVRWAASLRLEQSIELPGEEVYEDISRKNKQMSGTKFQGQLKLHMYGGHQTHHEVSLA